MRTDAIELEESRLEGLDFNNYPWFHERHRIFPSVLIDKPHGKVLDIAAGVGIVGKRIQEGTDAEVICNDISPKCLETMRSLGLQTISFDLDDPAKPFPYADASFDVVISLAILEHIIHLEHHLQEVRRILKPGGHLFISTPNYTGLQFLKPFLLKGETFHDPLGDELSRYEFYAHVRYFTYNTLLRFVRSFGFMPHEVYLPLPAESTKYRRLSERSKVMAKAFRVAMWAIYRTFSPRWAFHPVLCFKKGDVTRGGMRKKPAKRVI